MKNKKKEQTTAGTEITIAKVATGIGVGIVAGLAGTLVMTAAQMIEMHFSGREASETPYKAVKKTFGIEATSAKSKELVSNVTHYAYGSTWGIPRGLLATLGVNGIAGTTTHFGAVWGTELGMLPAMGVAEPVTTWKPKAIAEDALFHAVYAVAAGLTADMLTRWIEKTYAHKA